MLNLHLRQSIQRRLCALMAVIISVLIPIGAIAQPASPFYWDFINVDIAVQTNGDLWVTETQKYVFTQDHTNQRYRYIPLDKVDAITDVQVLEDDVPLAAQTGIRNNQLWISWQHDLQAPADHIFVLKYRVVGGLRSDDTNAQLYWRAIFPDRSAPINNATITVQLPSEVAGQVSDFKSFGVATNSKLLDEQTLEFVAQRALVPQRYIDVQATFPRHLLQLAGPQQKTVVTSTPEAEAPVSDTTGVLFLIFVLLSPLILLGGMLFLGRGSGGSSHSEPGSCDSGWSSGCGSSGCGSSGCASGGGGAG